MQMCRKGEGEKKFKVPDGVSEEEEEEREHLLSVWLIVLRLLLL